MAEHIPSLREIAFRELESTTCACGGEKQKRQSFCRTCYFTLPKSLREDLYKTFSEGYAEAWDECLTWLRANTDRLKKRQGMLL